MQIIMTMTNIDISKFNLRYIVKKDTLRFFATTALIVSVLSTFHLINTRQEAIEAKSAATSSSDNAILNSAAS